MSSAPTTRSSVAPRGKSTTGTMRVRLLDLGCSAQKLHSGDGRTGSQLYGQPATTLTNGNIDANARTAVLLAVPRCPIIITPPIDGSMTHNANASLSSLWPTMAVNGKTWWMLGCLTSLTSSISCDIGRILSITPLAPPLVFTSRSTAVPITPTRQMPAPGQSG